MRISDWSSDVCSSDLPKALAVAAKATVMRELGLPAPRVLAVESHAVGANWQAGGGWTDGRHRLGTSPEKDIGFPYRSNRSEERRVGQEGVNTCRSRWSP